MSEVKKVVLAYSGGLDTSIIIPWLKEHYNNCEVIAVCGNVGQKGELEGLEERAKASGASKLYIEDLTDEFVEDYVIPTMQAGADYEGYLLGTSFARPILAKRVVEIARAEGADAVCHGSTGKGNDQEPAPRSRERIGAQRGCRRKRRGEHRENAHGPPSLPPKKPGRAIARPR